MFDSDEDYFTKEAYKRGRYDAFNAISKELCKLLENCEIDDQPTVNAIRDALLEVMD